MPGQLKEVRNRIRSVQSIQQITKAMKMVSAAKLRRAQDAIVQMRPYAQKLQEMLQNIVSNSTGDADMSLADQRPAEKILLVVITSDRGLCGAYNMNLIKLTKQTIRKKYQEQFDKGNVTIMPVGKKGYDHFSRHNFKVNKAYRDLFLNLSFEGVQQASAEVMKEFLNKEYDIVEIIYSRFKNAVTQEFQVERFLPIPRVDSSPKAETGKQTEGKKLKADFIFEPDEVTLITELMPKILNTQFFKAILDAHASEHGARMTSMDKASDNADELLRAYRISYNRARQAAITTELTEIVSGAAALEG
ncbi:MAG: ATP synthase F1 subunit gamma [Chitinophagaceae bacterium]|jgi:F-type H+-transporting ATPase subunit gamma|nr:MAG: ATP synthase F1 subunit gamma [Chitinophagaceae bacterium]